MSRNGGSNTASYRFINESPAGDFILGPLTVAGRDVYLKPSTRIHQAVGEIKRFQRAVYQESGVRSCYQDGVLCDTGKHDNGKNNATPVVGALTEAEIWSNAEQIIMMARHTRQ